MNEYIKWFVETIVNIEYKKRLSLELWQLERKTIYINGVSKINMRVTKQLTIFDCIE